jgi:hypothetical protein
LDELRENVEFNQWLDLHQYTLRLCASQDEEMSIIGAFCYGSLFMF